MKNLILLLVVGLLGFNSFGQKNNFIDTNWRNLSNKPSIFSKKYRENKVNSTVLDSSTIMLKKELSPGDELIKFSKHYYTSVYFTYGGAALFTFGTLSYSGVINDWGLDEDVAGIVFMGVGGGLVIAGTILNIESHIHAKKAGLLLNKNGIGVKINI